MGGGIFANIGFNLHDLNDDGKMRFGEIGDAFAMGPLCLFDVQGELGAQLSAYLKVGFGPFSVTKRFKLAEITLLDFNFNCEEDMEPPKLASKDGGGC